MKVEIYSKPGCHLCEVAKAALERVQARIPFELVEVDLTHEPLLRKTYRYDIPVVLLDGEVLFKHVVDEAVFEERLRERLKAVR